MLDLPHLPNAANGSELAVFFASGANDWQAWTRPRGKRFARVLLIGGGAGGGGGCTGASGSARGGGGGGAAAAYAMQDLALDLLPETLFINVATGGAGGAAGVAGSVPSSANSGVSSLSLQPNTTALNLIAVSGGSAPRRWSRNQRWRRCGGIGGKYCHTPGIRNLGRLHGDGRRRRHGGRCTDGCSRRDLCIGHRQQHSRWWSRRGRCRHQQ